MKFGDLSKAPLSNTLHSSRTRFGHLRPSSLASGKPLRTEERASYNDNNSPAQHIRQTKSTSSFQDVPSCLNFYSVFKELLLSFADSLPSGMLISGGGFYMLHFRLSRAFLILFRVTGFSSE